MAGLWCDLTPWTLWEHVFPINLLGEEQPSEGRQK